MRILVVGAGALGGYFGGRLLQHGRDVTFLVRAGRAAQLARDGLRLRSPTGDVDLPPPPTVAAAELHAPYDLVILGCKAYGIEQAMRDMAPAVGPDTTILPLLNGMAHLDRLDATFGAARVLGGRCLIPATLDAEGTVRHLGRSHELAFGERDGSASERMQRITAVMQGAAFDAQPSTNILQDMWDKWIFLAPLAGITCLMRGSIGEITAAPGGKEATLAMLEECRAVATCAGYAPSEATMQRATHMLTEAGSSLTASMLRDLQQGSLTEADHVLGDLLARAGQDDPQTLLRAAYVQLKVYESQRVLG